MVDGAELSTTIYAIHTESQIFNDLTTYSRIIIPTVLSPTALRSQLRIERQALTESLALSSDWVNALKLHPPEKSDHLSIDVEANLLEGYSLRILHQLNPPTLIPGIRSSSPLSKYLQYLGGW